MAQFDPPPPIDVSEDPTRNQIWKKWFTDLFIKVEAVEAASGTTDHNGLTNNGGTGSHATISTFLANNVIGTDTQAWDADLDTFSSVGESAYARVAGDTYTGVYEGNDTTESTSTTTGSIHTDGGLGVVKDVFVGGDVDIDGHIAVGNGATISPLIASELVETFTAADFTSHFGSNIDVSASGTTDFAGGITGSKVQVGLSSVASIALIGGITGTQVGVTYGTASNVAEMRGFIINQTISAGSGTLADAFGVKIEAPSWGVKPTNATGFKIANQGGTASGVTTAIALQIDAQLNATNKIGQWFNGDGAGADLVQGAGKDAAWYYDGNNYVCDPKLVGTGYVDILGDIHADSFVMNTQQTYTLNATSVVDRTLLASASATTINNNNVLAGLITDLKTAGIIA